MLTPHRLIDYPIVAELRRRIGGELGAEFSSERPIRYARAPGRLDVMGGIADYTGSLVCQATLDRAAAAAVQERGDRNVQVISLNLLDENQPFTIRVPLDALAEHSAATLQSEFNQPGRRWAAYLAGCLAILHGHGLVDLRDPKIRGVNIALLSDVPLGAGVSSSAAIEVAVMLDLVHHLGIAERVDGLEVAALCQEVENRIVGAPCGIMDQVASCLGESGKLLRMICQPHEILPPLPLPAGIRAVGINSRVKHSVGGGQYGMTRCAAFMAHRMILEQIRAMGRASGAELTSDPMRGYLANLDPDDFKKLFRPLLPEIISGQKFLAEFGSTIDTVTTVDPGKEYHVRQAADHHVLEARRVRRFAEALEAAAVLAAGSREHQKELNKAGHLMYASHISYTDDALLGAPECDLLVSLVRERESHGLYGAKITGGGCGGAVAVLADISASADAAIEEILRVYRERTGLTGELFAGSSPGAWGTGTGIL